MFKKIKKCLGTFFMTVGMVTGAISPQNTVVAHAETEEKCLTKKGIVEPAQQQFISTNDYICKYADPQYVGDPSALKQINIIQLVSTMFEAGKLDDETLYGMWQMSPEYADAFCGQFEETASVYTSDPEKSPYWAVYAGVMRSDTAIVREYQVGYNATAGITFDDCIYDKNTGIVYIPREHFYNEETGHMVLNDLKIQLLYKIINQEKAITVTNVLIHSDGVRGDVAKSGQVVSDLYTMMMPVRLANDETALADITENTIESITVNSITISKDKYYYDQNTGLLEIFKPASHITDIEIFLENNLGTKVASLVERTATKDAKLKASAFQLDDKTEAEGTYYFRGAWYNTPLQFNKKPDPVKGNTFRIASKNYRIHPEEGFYTPNWGVAPNIYYDDITTTDQTKIAQFIEENVRCVLWGNGSSWMVDPDQCDTWRHGDWIPEENQYFRYVYSLLWSGSTVYGGQTVTSGSEATGDDLTMTIPVECNFRMFCSHTEVSANFEMDYSGQSTIGRPGEEVPDDNTLYTDDLGTHLKILRVFLDEGSTRKGDMIIGLVHPTLKTQTGVGLYMVRWELTPPVVAELNGNAKASVPVNIPLDIVKRDADTKNPLAGAVFDISVKGVNGNNNWVKFETKTTDENGKLPNITYTAEKTDPVSIKWSSNGYPNDANDLPLTIADAKKKLADAVKARSEELKAELNNESKNWEFKVTEVTPPAGYTKQGTTELTGKPTISGEILNKNLARSLTKQESKEPSKLIEWNFKKVDAQTNNPLTGGSFDIYISNWGSNFNQNVPEQGKDVYTLVASNVSASNGQIKGSETITAPSKTFTSNSVNYVEDWDSLSAENKTHFAGYQHSKALAETEAQDQAKTLAEAYDTAFQNAPRQIKIVEKTAPTGYKISANGSFTVNSDGDGQLISTSGTDTIKNQGIPNYDTLTKEVSVPRRVPLTLNVVKKDYDTKKELQDAIFDYYVKGVDGSTDWVKFATKTTDANGKLPDVTYTATTPRKATVSVQYSTNGIVPDGSTMPKSKTEAETKLNQMVEEKQTELTNVVNDEVKNWEFKIVEATPPAGYAKHGVSELSGNPTISGTIYNKTLARSLNRSTTKIPEATITWDFKKVDEQTKKPLSGGKFDIYISNYGENYDPNDPQKGKDTYTKVATDVSANNGHIQSSFKITGPSKTFTSPDVNYVEDWANISQASRDMFSGYKHSEQEAITEAEGLATELATTYDTEFKNAPHKIKIVEKEAPEGYIIIANGDFVLNADGTGQLISQNGTGTILNAGSPTLISAKTTVDGKTKIAGAKFTLTRKSDGKLIDEWTTTTADHIVNELQPNTEYVLTEIVVPEGYVAPKVNTTSFTTSNKVEDIRKDVKNACVTFKKTDFTSEEVEGAHITVTDENNKIVDEWVSTKEEHAIKGLEEGKTYKLTETVAPGGYNTTNSITFTTNDKDQLQEMVDYVTRVMKVDDNGNRVKGAVLQVLDPDKKVLDEWTSGVKLIDLSTKTLTDAGSKYNGDREIKEIRVEDSKKVSGEKLVSILFTNLDAEYFEVDTNGDETAHRVRGLDLNKTYTLHEEKAPSGYIKAQDKQFKADQKNDTLVTMKDSQIRVSKQDITGVEIIGAKLEVKDEQGNVVDEWISTSEPHYIQNLEWNKKYTLTETIAPQGYVQASPMPFETTDDYVKADIVLIDTIHRIIKVGPDKKPIKNAKLAVLDKSGKLIDQWTTGSHIIDLESNQISSANSGEHVVITDYTVQLSEDDVEQMKNELVVAIDKYHATEEELQDDLKPVEYLKKVFEKLDLSGDDFKEQIAYAENIINEKDSDEAKTELFAYLDTCITEANNKIKETTDDVVKVELFKNDQSSGGYSLMYTFKDGATRYVDIDKVGDEANHRVSGLVNGEEYIIREIESPSGFQVAMDINFIADENQDLKLTMIDQYVAEVKTGIEANQIIIYIGLGALVILLGYGIYITIRNTKKQ